MIIRIIDLETATALPGKPGFDPTRICEIAFLDWDSERDVVLGCFQSLVSTPIAPEHSQYHQIIPEMVEGAPTLDEVFETIQEEHGAPDAYCAHHSDFEEAFLGALRGRFQRAHVPWICTWKCAMKAVPDLESHSNQALRYTFRLPLWDHPCMDPPHRALPDVNVTLLFLRWLMGTYTPEELIAATNAPVLLKKVSFGQHYGKLWGDMDAGFYQWVLKNDFDADTHHTARHWLEERRKSPKQPFDERKE